MPRYVAIALISVVLVIGIIAGSLYLLYKINQENPTTVMLEGTDAPSFRVAGSGRLKSFRISDGEVTSNPTSPLSDSRVLWELKAVDNRGRFLRDIAYIKYGSVPNGYLQAVPSAGTSAPVLRRDHPYLYWLETWNAPSTGRLFRLDAKGRALPLASQATCWKLVDSIHEKWEKTNCL